MTHKTQLVIDAYPNGASYKIFQDDPRRGRNCIASDIISDPNATFNAMLIQVCIEGLQHESIEFPVQIVTNAEYISNGIERDMPLWKCNGWRKKNNKPVLNVDRWKELSRILFDLDVSVLHVKSTDPMILDIRKYRNHKIEQDDVILVE